MLRDQQPLQTHQSVEIWKPNNPEDWKVFSIISQLQRTETREYDSTLTQEFLDIHSNFVGSIAKNYEQWGVSFEELMQAGNQGLLKSASKFEIKYGYRFTTYAYHAVQNSIEDYLAERLFGKSRRVWKTFSKYSKIYNNSLQEYNSDQNYIGVLEKHKESFTESEYLFLRNYFIGEISTDQFEDGLIPFMNSQNLKFSRSTETTVFSRLSNSIIEESLSKLVEYNLLSLKEKLVLQLSFGITEKNMGDLVDEDIAALLGIAEDSNNARKVIYSYRVKALKKLRSFFEVLSKQDEISLGLNTDVINYLYSSQYLNETEAVRMIEVITNGVNISNHNKFAKSKNQDPKIWKLILDKMANIEQIIETCSHIYAILLEP